MSTPAPAAPELSFVIPARNEIENLPELIAEIRSVLAALGRSAEILVVDDASDDGSFEWLTREARADARLRAIRLPRQSGQSAALEDADVVSGVRRNRQDTWLRRVSSGIANGVRRAVIGDRITDIGCSLKAYRREALERVPYFTTMHRFLPALCQFRGARVRELEVSHRARRHGTSRYSTAHRLARGIADLVGVRWLKSRLIAFGPPREEG